MHYLELIEEAYSRGELPEMQRQYLRHFAEAYIAAASTNGWTVVQLESLQQTFIELILKQVREPYIFEPYHKAIKTPFNYYQFGIELIKPLVKFEESGVIGHATLDRIQKQLQAGENVVLFANHQIEPDPQAISVMLEKEYPVLGQEMIFIAGHRVTTDPMAAALTVGRNLLCIYSKNYIEHPAELKADKIRHNQRTIRRMLGLFDEGGHCVYVAPSGGRDRPDKNGILDVAKFDAQNIDLFLFLGKRAKRPVHFYPLALYSYELIPPPNKVEIELGELRSPHAAPLRLAFGEEFLEEVLEKESGERAEIIWEAVKGYYKRLVGEGRQPHTPLKQMPLE